MEPTFDRRAAADALAHKAYLVKRTAADIAEEQAEEEAATKADINALNSALNAKFKTLGWMIGVVGALVLIVIGKLLLLP